MTNRQFKWLTALLAMVSLIAAACGGSAKGGGQSTPTLAYKALYEAVKKKDHEAIKKTLTKGTLEMANTMAAMQKKTPDQVIENGFTETTFSPNLPEMRNEQIWGDVVAILEVKDEKKGTWEKLPFAKEDGQWKLAIDSYFRGTMSPNGPTNTEHPGELPPGAKPGPPQGAAPTAPGAQPPLKQGAQPGMPPAPGAMQPAPPPAPTQSAKPGAAPEKKKDIKPPTQ